MICINRSNLLVVPAIGMEIRLVNFSFIEPVPADSFRRSISRCSRVL